MPLQIRGNSQIKTGSVENAQIKDSDLSLSKLSGEGSVSIADGHGFTFAAGSTLDIATTLNSSGQIKTSLTTDSSSDGSDGAMLVSGGAYIAKKLYVGTDLSALGSVVLGTDENDTVQINGNLTVNGTMTTLSATELTIEDKLITLSDGSSTDAEANGSGITFGGHAGAPELKYVSATDLIDVSKPVQIGGDLKSSDGTSMIIDSTKKLNFSNMSTSDLSEGTNLYYTEARWDAKMAGADTGDLSEGSNKYYTEARFDARLATKSTDDLTEGSNLYYTQGRFDTALSGKSTDDVSEGSSNLYYTEARWDSKMSAADTDDLSEGSSNLYYTDARSRGSISVVDSAGDGSLSYDSATGVITYAGITDAAILGKISVNDVSGDGSLTYNSSTGVISYTGPSSAEVRAHVSGGDGLSVTDGEFEVNVDDSSIEIDNDILRVKASGITNAMLNGSISHDKIDFMIDQDNMSDDSAVKVPTQQSVKAYVDSQVSSGLASGGFDSVSDMDFQIGKGGSFVRVKKEIALISVDSNMENANAIDLANSVGGAKEDSTPELQNLCMVFLNGQKLRIGASNEFIWNPADAGQISFTAGVISDGDDLEIHYYIEQ